MKGGDAVEAEALEETEVAGAEGFVLEEIEMRGFMRYVERTDPPLRFPEKFTAITGRTGAGKSSILDAITFALYGSTTRTDIQSVKTSDICRPGGYVRVAFHQGDARWEVRRGFTTKKDSYLEVLRDGDAVPGSIHEKEQTIRDVVGLDYVGFRNSTFVRQEEMKDLGAARGADRLAIFQTLFRLEVFDKALERSKLALAALQVEQTAKEAEIAARSEALQRLPVTRSDLASTQAVAAARSREAEGLQDKVRAAEARLHELEGRHEAWVRLQANAEDRRAQLERLRRREAEVREKGALAAGLEAERRALAADLADLDGLREKEDALRERSQLHQQREIAARAAEKVFDQAKRDHERRRDQIKDRIDQLHRKISGLHTELDRDAAFNLLRDEGRLEERLARIEREVEWLSDRPATVRQLEAERSRASKALEHVRGKVGSISQDAFVLSELRRELDELKEDLKREADESHATLKPLDDAKVAALRQLDEAPFTEADRKTLDATARSIAEKSGRRKNLEPLAERLRGLGDMTALLADLDRQRAAVEADGKDLAEQTKALEPTEAAYQAARRGIEELRKELEEAQREVHVLEGRAAQLALLAQALEGDATRLKEAERERSEIRTRMEVHEVLVNRVFHKRGVVMYAVDQLLPELEIEASKNLSELTAGRFSRIRMETYEEGRGHGIRILVQGVDRAWHDVGEFSGGEKTQINAALRFAIARELASMPQIGRTYGRMKTLFIDEGDLGSLDSDVSRELFVQKLFRMGEFFDKVILITHLAEVAERFPGRIQVSMTPNQESRVEVLA